jgi:uncharacterized repeat protein (TIGR01451 family)
VPSDTYPTLTAALADPDCDPILVSAGTYTENLTIQRPVTIQGDGAETTIVDGGGLSAVFVITNTASVTLTGLSIRNGVGVPYSGTELQGGGVYNRNGQVTILDSIIHDNRTDWAGGLWNFGHAHVERTAIMSNTVTNGGGGIVNHGTLLLVDSALLGNSAGHGGGVQNQANLVISRTLISGNQATSYLGGGIFNLIGTTWVDDSVISHNESLGSGGGGVANSAQVASSSVTLNRSQIVNNTTSTKSNGGGGLLNTSDTNLVATMTLNDCQVSHNFAPGSLIDRGTGGGIWNTVFVESDNATAILTLNETTVSHNQALNGAGISNSNLEAGTGGELIVNVNHSALHDNVTLAEAGDMMGNGGGVLNVNGTLNVTNSTISGNSANGIPSSELDYSGLGGGILNAGSLEQTVTHLVHTTITDNFATIAGGGLLAALLDVGGSGSYVSLQHSIVADNIALLVDDDCSSQPDFVPSMLASQGYNLDGDGTCNLTQPTDQPETDPLLGPLADNSRPGTHDGDTLTHALLNGSPAIDLIPAAACLLPIDQRGVMRPQGAGCDAGAYEAGPDLQVTKTVATAASGGTAQLPPGEVVTYTIRIQNAGPVPALGVVLTDVLPSGVTFDTGILTGSLELPAPDTLSWGPWDVETGTAYTLKFTALVTDSPSFAGRPVTNRVDYTSENAGTGASRATFTIQGYSIYLPLLKR